MSDLTADEHAILAYLADVADAGFVSLRGMLPADRAALPREELNRSDWERWLGLYFAVDRLLADGLVVGVAADGGEHLNRFRITDAGRAVVAAGPAQPSTPKEAS
jgi:hypothetical protein